MVDGIEVDLTSHMRLLSRVERRSDQWRLSSLEAIYERDTIAPTNPSQRLSIDDDELSQLRSSYRFLAWVQKRIGWPSQPDLPGDDRPDEVAEIYRRAEAWLRQAVTTPTAS